MSIAKTAASWSLSLILGCLLTTAAWAATDQSQSPSGGSPGMGGSTNMRQHGSMKSTGIPKARLNQQAPDFQLQDASGQSHSLADYKGKTIVLIWSNPDCTFVQRHQREGTLQNLANKYGPDKVQFIQIEAPGAPGPSQQSQARTSSQGGANILTLWDANGQLSREYGAKRTPEVFIINSDGRLVYRGAFDNDARGNKEMSQRKNYVDEALSSVVAGQTPRNQSTRLYGCPIKGEKSSSGFRFWERNRGSQSSGRQQQSPGGASSSGSSSPSNNY